MTVVFVGLKFIKNVDKTLQPKCNSSKTIFYFLLKKSDIFILCFNKCIPINIYRFVNVYNNTF